MTHRARHWRDRNYEPVGRFSDLPRPAPIKASDRPVYTLRIRPEPGVNDGVALRMAVKAMLRRFGYRCVDYRRDPPMKAAD